MEKKPRKEYENVIITESIVNQNSIDNIVSLDDIARVCHPFEGWLYITFAMLPIKHLVMNTSTDVRTCIVDFNYTGMWSRAISAVTNILIKNTEIALYDIPSESLQNYVSEYMKTIFSGKKPVITQKAKSTHKDIFDTMEDDTADRNLTYKCMDNLMQSGKENVNKLQKYMYTKEEQNSAQRKIIAKKYVNSSIEAILLEKIHNSNVVIMGVEAEKYHQIQSMFGSDEMDYAEEGCYTQVYEIDDNTKLTQNLEPLQHDYTNTKEAITMTPQQWKKYKIDWTNNTIVEKNTGNILYYNVVLDFYSILHNFPIKDLITYGRIKNANAERCFLLPDSTMCIIVDRIKAGDRSAMGHKAKRQRQEIEHTKLEEILNKLREDVIELMKEIVKTVKYCEPYTQGELRDAIARTISDQYSELKMQDYIVSEYFEKILNQWFKEDPTISKIAKSILQKK